MGEDFKYMYILKVRFSVKFNGNGCRWIIYGLVGNLISKGMV